MEHLSIDSSDLKPTNPKDKDAISRIDLTLFPDTATLYGAWAMTEGHQKYGAFNYRPAGVLASVYVAAARRHLAKWYNREDFDAKSLVHHLGSALACIAVIIDSLEAGSLKDDRPPRVDISRLTDSLEEKVKHLQKLYPDGPGRFVGLSS